MRGAVRWHAGSISAAWSLEPFLSSRGLTQGEDQRHGLARYPSHSFDHLFHPTGEVLSSLLEYHRLKNEIRYIKKDGFIHLAGKLRSTAGRTRRCPLSPHSLARTSHAYCYLRRGSGSDSIRRLRRQIPRGAQYSPLGTTLCSCYVASSCIFLFEVHGWFHGDVYGMSRTSQLLSLGTLDGGGSSVGICVAPSW